MFVLWNIWASPNSAAPVWSQGGMPEFDVAKLTENIFAWVTMLLDCDGFYMTTLSHYHTAMLVHYRCHTVTLSHFHTIALSYSCNTITDELINCDTVTKPHTLLRCHYNTFPCCLMITLLYPCTVTPLGRHIPVTVTHEILFRTQLYFIFRSNAG